jgi:hypothetical protein
MANLTQAAQNINTANKGQSSQGLIIQTYANSVNEQPDVDFSGIEKSIPDSEKDKKDKLENLQKEINNGLKTAQGHANNYLENIQPKIIQNISNIGNYYALNNAVPAALPPGSTAAQWISNLTILQTQSVLYQNDAKNVVASLGKLSTDLTMDVRSFMRTVTSLNEFVNGNNGVLASDDRMLRSIQTRLDAAIAGVVTSGLAIIGGAFLIAVGSVADFVTAGTSTPVVVGGIGILTSGIGGEAASAVVLAELNNEKRKLLEEEARLTAEVKLAMGISSGYQGLENQAKMAVEAATQMQLAWEFLSNDLGSLISDLQNGIMSVEQVRTLFLTAANTVIQTVISDINTIKGQLTGVTSIVAEPGQTVGQVLIAAAMAVAA